MSKVKMVSLEFGSTVGPSGHIVHTDPDGSAEAARFPMVDERDVDKLVLRGKARPWTEEDDAEEEALHRSMDAVDGVAVKGVMVDEPLAGTGEAILLPPVDGSAPPPPVATAERPESADGGQTATAGAVAADGDGLSVHDPDAPPIASPAVAVKKKPGPKPKA